MPFQSDREALRHLVDAIAQSEDPNTRAALDAVCVHLLSPDPALARMRRSLCETAAALDRVDRLLLHELKTPYEHPRGEVTRARAILQETAQ